MRKTERMSKRITERIKQTNRAKTPRTPIHRKGTKTEKRNDKKRGMEEVELENKQ
jgi:hypothetical protein